MNTPYSTGKAGPCPILSSAIALQAGVDSKRVYKKYKVQRRTVFPCHFFEFSSPTAPLQLPLTDPFQARPAHCFHLRACADGNPLGRALPTRGSQPAHTPPSLPHPCPASKVCEGYSTSPSAHPRWRTRACTPSFTRCPHVNLCTRRASLPHPCFLASFHCTVHACLFGFASHTCLSHSFFFFPR